jgi:DNA-binding MarR family transcriptional regulator
MEVQRETMRERAFSLFGQAMARSDPGRLEGWVELGLTITQLRVLFRLRADDGTPAGALAERLRVTPSTLTRIVDRLARQELVRRETDHGDRRLVRHYLTATGASTLEAIIGGARARMDEVVNRLSARQLERLVLALEDLTVALDAQEAEEISRGEG